MIKNYPKVASTWHALGLPECDTSAAVFMHFHLMNLSVLISFHVMCGMAEKGAPTEGMWYLISNLYLSLYQIDPSLFSLLRSHMHHSSANTEN